MTSSRGPCAPHPLNPYSPNRHSQARLEPLEQRCRGGSTISGDHSVLLPLSGLTHQPCGPIPALPESNTKWPICCRLRPLVGVFQHSSPSLLTLQESVGHNHQRKTREWGRGCQ